MHSLWMGGHPDARSAGLVSLSRLHLHSDPVAEGRCFVKPLSSGAARSIHPYEVCRCGHMAFLHSGAGYACEWDWGEETCDCVRLTVVVQPAAWTCDHSSVSTLDVVPSRSYCVKCGEPMDSYTREFEAHQKDASK